MNWLVLPTLGAALVLFFAGREICRRSPSTGLKAIAATVCFLLGIPGFLLASYYLHGFDHARWFYQFRSLPFAELTAAGAGLSAGALGALVGGNRFIAQPFFIIVLCLGIVVPYLKPIVAPAATNQFSDRWRDNVCLQSTAASCGAASAATVFRAFGLPLTEREIAEECFTYRGGTENWYLARAFRRRGFAVNYRIEAGLPGDLHTPAIAGVRVAGVGHFIVILGRSGSTYVIGDPLVGRREVPEASLTKTLDFTGFFMEIHGTESSPCH
jgi:predicted double-glycine peptidase